MHYLILHLLSGIIYVRNRRRIILNICEIAKPIYIGHYG